MKKIILVFGATGNQGGAVVKALLKSDFVIRAVTRNPEQEKSKALANQGVALVKADFQNKASLKQALQGVYGVYSVQNFVKGGIKQEEEQGKLLATLAKDAGVKHFVYSSVGGAERKTGVGHFDSKWLIEEHIRSLNIPHTIIRPVFFMENFVEVPPFMLFSIFRGTLQNKTLQMIAVEDIGKWVAKAFSDPEQYINQNLEIAGDELDYSEMQDVWAKVKGKKQSCIRLPAFVISMMGDLGKMFLWFRDEGYQADITQSVEQIENSLTFEKWLIGQRK